MWPLILFGADANTRRPVEQALVDQDTTYNIALEVDNAELAKRYVEIGLGVALCSDFSLQPEDYSRLGVLPLDHLYPNSAIGVLRLKGRFLGRSIRNFVELLKEQPSDSNTNYRCQNASCVARSGNRWNSCLTPVPPGAQHG